MWNPFSSIWDGITSVVSGVGSFFGDVFDPLGLFHTTSGQRRVNDQWDKNYYLQTRALQDQEAAFEYQKQYDKWAQNFAQSQDQFSRESFLRTQDFQENAFNQQMALAQSPVSSVVKDAAKVGVNPMAALGMSAGSASASSTSYSPSGAPASGAHEGFGASTLAPINNMSSLISALGSVGSAHIGAAQDDRDSKRAAALRQQELEIIKDKNQKDFELGSRSLDIRQQDADTNSTNSGIQKQLADANDRMTSLEFQKFAFNKTKDIKTYLLDKARFNRSVYESDRDYAQKVNQFNRQYDELVREFNEKIKTADKDRRMQYITRFSGQATRLLGSIFGRGGSSSADFSDGFLDNMLKGGL